ncbi:hypothetical protein [Mesorhizobium sp. BR1-1-2]|uniref:hypothetical protein n=1 Tax=Mesorhizobium sp. BR1-1-2 TaxID=2876652 RepID=UPI001CCAA318|nr:hypothetical protein [Mesorhizobium sp. BR1-1-2]MBZ9965577.1 hypothetical protein [Mesorhizobium sp. BR1-1-2]
MEKIEFYLTIAQWPAFQFNQSRLLRAAIKRREMTRNDKEELHGEIPAMNEEWRTDKLVIALVGSAGSGASTTATALAAASRSML